MINQKPESKGELILFISEIINSLIPIFKSWYFYIGLISAIAGVELNYANQIFLYNNTNEGKDLPMLSDLILDNLPLYNVSLIYDIFSLVPVIVILIYIIHKKDYNRIPFFLIMFGIFEIIRGIFIVLTPLGNPPGFTGSDSILNGLSKYEVGVYPSGHAGSGFLFFLLVKDKWYKGIIFFCLIIVIISLLFAHAHYTIDILSGLLFAYALNSYGEKHLKMFELGNMNKMQGRRNIKGCCQLKE